MAPPIYIKISVHILLDFGQQQQNLNPKHMDVCSLYQETRTGDNEEFR